MSIWQVSEKLLIFKIFRVNLQAEENTILTVKGKVENGKVLPLEPISDSYEGKEVIITLADEQSMNEESDWERLFAAIEENQIDADIIDLAHQHDHYLYGTPKRED